jgi:hypothetical protein
MVNNDYTDMEDVAVNKEAIELNNPSMVNNDYTIIEDVAINEEAIELNNPNNDNQDNGNNNDRNSDIDDDEDDNVLYSKVATMKKRKKGARSKPMMPKKRKSKGTTKCNKKSWHNNNTSINHDFVISGKGDADVEGDADSEDSDDNVDLFKEKRYKKTNATNWMKHESRQPGREIHPIPFTGASEFFPLNITDKETKEMIDKHGNVCFHTNL